MGDIDGFLLRSNVTAGGLEGDDWEICRGVLIDAGIAVRLRGVAGVML